MNFTFDNLSELDEFLQWARRYGVAHAMSQGFTRPAGPVVAQAAPPDTPYPTIDTAGVAFDTPPEPADPDASARMSAVLVAGAEAAGRVDRAAEPKKRARRAKAEIEADKAAVAAAGDVALVGLQPDAMGAREPAGDAQQPDGTNPFEQVAEAAAGAASAVDDAAAPDESSGGAIVTPFQHLTRGRDFIAKHGIAKYNESFKKADLGPNVMGYSAYQRALHMAALDELEKA